MSAAAGVSVTTATHNPYIGVLAALDGWRSDEHGPRLPGHHPQGQPAGQWPGTHVPRVRRERLDRQGCTSGPRSSGSQAWTFPRLAGLPPVYSSLFRFDILILLVIPVAILLWWLLFRTRWGLGVRAVGENPDIAFASGRNRRRDPLPGAVAAGLLAGLGAAHLTIAYTMTWTEYMTAGRGFIAVALVIFSKWHPLRAIAGALLFSGAVASSCCCRPAGSRCRPSCSTPCRTCSRWWC